MEPAELIVTLDPLATRLPVLVTVCPTITLPKSMLTGFTESCPAELAEPVKPIPSEELDASEVNVRFPEAVPLTVGANFTLKVRLCPAASVAGSDNPLTLNSPDDTLACEIFTLVPPLFFTVANCVAVVPTWIVENARLLGLAANCPGVAAAAPVPLRATLSPVPDLFDPREFFLLPFTPFALMLILSVRVPADDGANVVLNVTLCPGASVTGNVIPLIA